jgi:ketosteroid isomerase-like protein
MSIGRDAGMTGDVDTGSIERWVSTYERLWRAAGTAGLDELFVEDATYQHSPYEHPFKGLAAIAEMWEAERGGPDETFSMATSIVAKEGDIAVVRTEVFYGSPVEQEYRDLWIIRFAPDGRCRSFEEWPFWPDKGPTASGSGG